MKIVVFVKQVPNTDDVQLDPKTGNLRRDGVESILNPMDANGVEAALQLKEKFGGTVCVVSMGLPMASSVGCSSCSSVFFPPPKSTISSFAFLSNAVKRSFSMPLAVK